MFFKQLSELADGVTLTLRIQHKNGTMAISVLPDGVDKIQPLITNGTPDWLDENFIGLIKAPLEHVKGVLVNADAFKDAAPVEKMVPKHKNQPDGEKVPASQVQKKVKKKVAPVKKVAEPKPEKKTEQSKDNTPVPTALELLMK